VPRVLLVVVSIALTVYAAIDCIQTEESRVRNLPKLAWVLLIVLVSIVGPVAWLLAGRPRSGPPRRGPSGPRGPEDDPDFLRNL
jgi:uncharacterized membrane protein AbrB (regulator of aidB expression)